MTIVLTLILLAFVTVAAWRDRQQIATAFSDGWAELLQELGL